MKLLKQLLIISLVLVGGWFLFKELTDFSLKNITMEMPYHPEWEIAPLTPEEQAQLDSVLSQPFTYLGKGNQAYAFESKDKKYVLKFFKFGHLKPSLFSGQSSSKLFKIQRIFSSHKLAYDLDKDNGALLYIQLNPNRHPQKTVTVQDRFGVTHSIDLGKVVFVVQRKTTPAREEISALLDKKDVETATLRFKALLELFKSEYGRGIYDQDHNLMHNTGFIDGKGIRFDVGKMAKDESLKENYQKDIDKVYARIDRWLERYYPQYKEQIMQAIK